MSPGRSCAPPLGFTLENAVPGVAVAPGFSQQGKPEKLKVHDFLDPERSKAIPYGVYDLGRNLGWVSA